VELLKIQDEKLEDLRWKLYGAIDSEVYEDMLRISQELDIEILKYYLLDN
jgi:hypothetical protein